MGEQHQRGTNLATAGVVLALALAAREAVGRIREADLTGAVALVTGGSRGLGLAIGRELAAQGCRLVICARDAAELDEARADLQRAGAEVLAIPCDVGDRDQVAEMVDQAERQFGRIDVLVNNAGIITVAPVEALTHDDFERVMDAIFWGMVNPTLAVLPGMRARGSGRIVNITSIGGKVAMPHLLPYTSAKFATVGFSNGLRNELADAGIAVTTVVPGLMRTGSFLRAEFGGDQEGEFRWFTLGASAPYPVATSAERAARMIVRAAKRGQAELTFPISAVVAARASGLMPGVTANVLELADRFLPDPTPRPTGMEPGIAVAPEADGPLFRAATTLGRAAAEEYNEIPPASDGQPGLAAAQ